MIQYPFFREWIVSKDYLKALKRSTNNILCVKSAKFTVINAPDIQYSLNIYPNGPKDEYRGQTWIYLNLNIGKEMKVIAEYSIYIKSANYFRKICVSLKDGSRHGASCCTVKELFDPSKHFIVDGNLTVTVAGSFKIKESNLEFLKSSSKNFGDLWDIGFEDFTIIVNKKEIKAHKNVLAAHSAVFNAMFNSGMKEAIENQVEIPDFSFEVVEKAIKLCYHQKLVSDISIEKSFSLLQFADKYNMAALQVTST
uniref:BTB domain-containing protein n=1 Tax=Panagrolaimus sp. ES5 TaxID=591445 RepID=A0AC34FYA3_9BILA